MKRNGFVFDRNGEFIDVCKSGYLTLVLPSGISENEIYDLSKKLSEESDKSQSFYFEKILVGRPFVVETNENVTDENLISFSKYDEKYDVLCHLLGYRDGDGKAVTGIMQAYDAFLSQYSSASVFARYVADAKGKSAGGTEVEIVDNGYTNEEGLFLTIDLDIQKEVERICSEHLDMGAVVVQDTVSGQILAMVSMPQYKKETLSEYLTSDRGELVNRCFVGYTPGSVFKTVVSAAALSDPDFDPYEKYECKGYIEVCGQKIRCHNVYGHGKVNLNEAFINSCNPYFIDLGLRLGHKKIVDLAHDMGIGQYSSINLVSCTEGVLPNSSEDGAVANMSVGQGEILLSPVQVASILSTCGTGIYCKPSVVKKTVADGDSVYYGTTNKKRVLDAHVVEKLSLMLAGCVTDGTGYRARSEKVFSAGKTATAQSGQIRDGKEVIHSWFAGFFPADSPRYTVCVLCDGNGVGNAHPSEIFRIVSEAITDIDKKHQE
ncbi:MAG: hypothetical protein E7656_01020 [Ruminococcaceae bacterium]|nr:hypothetical protein [Oscillospiraceae bacterium]